MRKTHRPVVSPKAMIVVKRLIDSKGQLDDTVIEIYHDGLRDVLLEINKDVRGLKLTARIPTVSRIHDSLSKTTLERWSSGKAGGVLFFLRAARSEAT